MRCQLDAPEAVLAQAFVALIHHALACLSCHRYVRKRQPERTGHWIVRSCFGGCNESFILSGSEECKARNSN